MKLNKLYSYDESANLCKQICCNYSNILKLKNYGYSHDLRNLFLIRIGHGPCKVLCTAGIHGRESINPIVLIKIIDTYSKLYILNNISINYKIKSILNRSSIVFIPFCNPDGYEIALNGYDSIRDFILKNKCKNLGIPHYEWKYNARGIDLNRNFYSSLWESKFEHDGFFSENETTCLKKVFDIYRPSIYIDFHSRGDSIYYYRNQKGILYNNKQLKIAKKIALLTDYSLYPPELETNQNDSGGNTVHYVSEVLNKAALTIETVNDNESFPLRPELQRKVFNQIVKLPLLLADL